MLELAALCLCVAGQVPPVLVVWWVLEVAKEEPQAVVQLRFYQPMQDQQAEVVGCLLALEPQRLVTVVLYLLVLAPPRLVVVVAFR